MIANSIFELGQSLIVLNSKKTSTVFLTGPPYGSSKYLFLSVLYLGSVIQTDFDYHIANIALSTVDSVRDLGVVFSSDLKFKSHIASVSQKSGYVCSTIFRNFVTRSRPFLVSMFITYVRPILEYNSFVWSPQYVIDIDRIESVQRSFTRVVL